MMRNQESGPRGGDGSQRAERREHGGRVVTAVVAALATLVAGVLTAGGAGAAYGHGVGGPSRGGSNGSVVVVDPRPGPAGATARPADLPEYLHRGTDGPRRAATAAEREAAATVPALGMHHVLVVPVYWDTQPSTTTTQLQATLSGSDTYYDKATAGRIRFSGEVRPWTKISFSQSDQDTCNFDPIEAKIRALAAGYETDSTHHLLAYLEYLPSCWWAGMATLGTGPDSSFVWINGYDDVSIWSHEFGHNLGLLHSGALYCRDGDVAVTLSSHCTAQTYADPWDLMGNQPFNGGMISAENLRRLGVLPADATQVISIDSTVTLAPLTSGAGVRGLTVSDGSATYLLEYRTKGGLDWWINNQTYVDPHGITRTSPGGGLVVRRIGPEFGQSGEQDVLDFHPDTLDLPYDSHPGLDPGESYTLPGGAVRFAFVGTSSAGAQVSVTFPKAGGVFRWSGDDRYSAAVAIAHAAFPSRVETLYVASGEIFTDALSGAAVAARRGAPLLLVRHDVIPATVADALYQLSPSQVIVLGGPNSVSDAVMQGLSTWGGRVTRIAGADRYETSALISRSTYAPGVDTAFIASGVVFPDALSGAPVAGRSGGPVLLVPGDRIPDTIAAELRRLAPKRIVVLGGTTTITPAVQATLAGFTAGSVERWDGADRYAVSALVSQHAFPNGSGVVFVASGLVFPDSLAGAPVAGATPAPLLLVRSDRIPDTVAAELTRLKPKAIVVLGGTSTVRSVVADQLAGYVR